MNTNFKEIWPTALLLAVLTLVFFTKTEGPFIVDEFVYANIARDILHLKVKSPPAEPGAYHWGASKALVNREPPRAAIPSISSGRSVHLRLPGYGCRPSPSPHPVRPSRQNSLVPKTLRP